MSDNGFFSPTGVSKFDGQSLVAGQNGNIEVYDVTNGAVLAKGATTARTLGAMAGDVANVFSYGAVANGTYDNTTPFNNASLANSVYTIPSGDYFVSYVPSPGTTTGTALLFGSNVSGSGLLGTTDGSATGESNKNVNGLAIVRGYGDDWNQHVLVVQGTYYNQSGNQNTQKNGIYANIINEQISNATSNITKDGVAIAGFGNISNNNSQGRVWGANFVASCPSGSDGQITGIEIDCNNFGIDQPATAQPNTKYGLTIYNLGSAFCTHGILIGSGFHYGLTFYGTNGTFAWNVLTMGGGQLAWTDTNGNIFGQTIRTPEYTVATLPSGTIGMRAFVTDATSPTFLGTLTGGGTVTCPVFYNGSAWLAG